MPPDSGARLASVPWREAMQVRTQMAQEMVRTAGRLGWWFLHTSTLQEVTARPSFIEYKSVNVKWV